MIIINDIYSYGTLNGYMDHYPSFDKLKERIIFKCNRIWGPDIPIYIIDPIISNIKGFSPYPNWTNILNCMGDSINEKFDFSYLAIVYFSNNRIDVSSDIDSVISSVDWKKYAKDLDY